MPKPSSQSDLTIKAEEISGKPIEKSSLVPEGYKRVKLETGQEITTSTNCDVKEIQSAIGKTWFIIDKDQKLFFFIGSGNQARDELLGKYHTGLRVHASKFKNFIHVELTMQNPNQIAFKMTPKP